MPRSMEPSRCSPGPALNPNDPFAERERSSFRGAVNRKEIIAAAICVRGPDIAQARAISCKFRPVKVQSMLIEAYWWRDCSVGAAAPVDQIEANVSRFGGVIPFRDGRIVRR